jgi:DNA-binding NtrC family response regulator
VTSDWDDEDRSTSLARQVRAERQALVLVDSAGVRQPLEQSLTLGSAKDVGVRVPHPTVSRLHARIEVSERGTYLFDLDSTNGTFVDGVRVTGAELRPGARIALGDATLQIATDTHRTRIELWPEDHFGELLGKSIVMRTLFERLAKVSKSDASVLVTGETGTGKELVARAIHNASRRKNRPFVTIDSGAIPENLFESELFGHARGAFTGADRMRDGAVQTAEGGTLFLDEVGELPLSLQPKLLRMLESRTVRRVGETASTPIDVRIVSATHRDLSRMVAVGAFREDLWFRLAVLPVHLPPLRERREDIALLATHLARGRALDTSTLARMAELSWLGNVRELRNFVERALALGAEDALGSPTLTPQHAPDPGTFSMESISTERPYQEVREELLEALERRYLEVLLAKTKWNVTAVADAMSMNRSHVHRLLKKHQITR